LRALTEETAVRTVPRPSWWAAVALVVGGAWLVVVWPVFTSLHGPTSVDEGGELFGGGVLFWGSLMEGPSGALIAVGLAGSYRLLTGDGGRTAAVGFALAMFGLVIPTTVNLAFQGQVPPVLAPVFGAGLILIAAGNRSGSWLTRFDRRLLLGQGGILIYSFLWFLAVRPDVLDRIDGYRIYGAVADVLFGVGWILLGASLIAHRRDVEAGEPAAAAAADS
jgi:hypothetical protein